MDILTNKELPFEVEFIVYNIKGKKEIRKQSAVEKFSTALPLDFIVDLELKEYDNLSIRFKEKESISNDIEARLYMDGLEIIDDLDTDNEEIPFLSLNQETMLHYHSDNNVSYPWIPGVYRLSIVWNNVKYYSQIIIKPNNINMEEHSSMIVEIERQAKGLARDWLRKNSTVDFFDVNSNINPTNIDLANQLLLKKTVIVNNLNIIKKNMYTELVKEYQLTPIEKAKRIDGESLKLYQNRPNSQFNGLSISKKVEIHSAVVKEQNDNNINRYLVKMIHEFILIVKNALIDTSALIGYVKSELAILHRYNKNNINEGALSKIKFRQNQLYKIEVFKEQIMNLNMVFNQFLKVNNFENVKLLHNVKLPKSIMKLYGYNMIYTIYKDLKKSISNDINDLYDYNWKSSEVLYEYWCFLQLIHILKEIDLTPIEGWIFSAQLENRILNIPSIPDDAYVTFRKDEYMVKLIFNSEIPKTPQIAEEQRSPYWIRANRNKPDFRIDIYYKNEYRYTIILDAKYSQANRIWNKRGENNYSKSNRTIEQFKIYANMIIKLNTRKENVVEEVIALCPSLISGNLQRDEDHLVSIATLKPSYQNAELPKLLKNLIFQNE